MALQQHTRARMPSLWYGYDSEHPVMLIFMKNSESFLNTVDG